MADPKVFYDSTVNKEVYDVSGTYTKQKCVDDCGFSSVANTQEVTLGANEAQEVLSGGVLAKFDHVARSAQDATDRETARQASEDAIKTKLDLSDSEYDDLVNSMK